MRLVSARPERGWVRIFYRDGNLIDFTELIAMPLSGSIANG
jgi:hypothetical protein